MIFRFCLYGFLKNLRFFEIFLILALRERGVDFLSIGTLVAVREIASNLSQIPSGALADAYGRKRCMVASMACYVASYLVLGLSGELWMLMLAMVFYGTADSFREGTHKALIYSWLRQHGREQERTEIYGYTRSWSKMGSAISALGAAALVFFTGNYSAVFMLSVVPAVLNLINLATYPAGLDGERKTGKDPRLAFRYLAIGMREIVTKASLRKLVRDSMAVEGSYTAIKDYHQVVAQSLAIALPVHLAWSGEQRAAVLVGISHFILHFLSSKASRVSHRFEIASGGTEPAIRRLYGINAVLFVVLAVALVFGAGWIAIAIFISLGVVQNLWRPIHIGRFDRDGEEKLAATTLSIESQSSSLAAAVWAPLVGLMIDKISHSGTGSPSIQSLWPCVLAATPVAFIAIRELGRTQPHGGK